MVLKFATTVTTDAEFKAAVLEAQPSTLCVVDASANGFTVAVGAAPVDTREE